MDTHYSQELSRQCNSSNQNDTYECGNSIPFSIEICNDGSKCIRVYENSPYPILNDTIESSWFEILRKLCAEMLGTSLLLLVVVGSGIMAQSLSPNDVGLQLLENAISTGTSLFGLIVIFGPVSGAHFNPVVSLVDYLNGDMNIRDVFLYSVSQIVGGIIGVIIANVEFNLPEDAVFTLSVKARDSKNLWLSEVIGTSTLILVIHGCIRTNQKAFVPYAVAAWVCGGYFFTSSTIFANPAVTIAREFSNTFAGIAPRSVGPFIGFQYLGALIGFGLVRFFYPHNLSLLRKDDNLYLRACLKDAFV
jgi:glycerol uptake facilitator-like aquaporin